MLMNNQEYYTEYFTYAKTAVENKQYEQAAEWLQMALDLEPESLEVLALLGEIYHKLGKHDRMLTCFSKAVQINPENGDNWFNMGNASLFTKNLPAAYDNYKEAERRGVSEDVLPRLYFQLAVLFGMKADIRTALHYMGKSEEADKNGNIALTHELLSQKVKLYLAAGDTAAALICAEKLVGAAPHKFSNYMILFSLQMSQKNYRNALITLEEAGKYAEMSADDRLDYALSQSGLMEAQAKVLKNGNPKKASQLSEAAAMVLIKALENGKDAKTLTAKNKVRISLAELYSRQNKHEDAVSVIREILEAHTIHGETKEPVPYTLSDPNFKDRLNLVLLTGRMAEKNYEEAEKIAADLKHSTNTHCANYGIYCNAQCVRMNRPEQTEEWKRAYTEAIAYFKNRMIRNPADTLALIFRARLHAECGNFEKAEELASLLSPEDSKTIRNYIEECRKQANQG